MERIRVILNPWSDRGRARAQKELIEAAARPFGGVEVVLTERPRHAQLLAREAAEAGYGLVVAAGGMGRCMRW